MFSENLKKYRLNQKLSKAELARKLNLQYTTYDNYERGTGEPKLNKLIEIANILNVSIDDLVGRTPADEDDKLEKIIRGAISNFESSNPGIKNPGIKLQFNYIDNNFINFEVGHTASKLIATGEINKADFIKQLSKIDIEITNTRAYKIFYYLAMNVIDDAFKKVNKDLENLCQGFDDIEKNTGKTIATLYEENKKYKNMIDKPLKIQSELLFLNQILYKYNENK